MTATLRYLSEMTDAIFARQMQRASRKIAARDRMFRARTK